MRNHRLKGDATSADKTMTEDTTDPRCKACGITVRLKPDDVARMVDDHLRASGGMRVDPAVRAHRLRLCLDCTDLDYGTTCRHCGCVVQVLTWIENKQCPRPGTPVW